MIVLFTFLASFFFWLSQNYVVTAHLSDTDKKTLTYHAAAVIAVILACVFILIAGVV